MSELEDQASVSDIDHANTDPDATADEVRSPQQFDQSESGSSHQTSLTHPQASEGPAEPPHDANTFFEIVVPAIKNPQEYEYLPGHFEAHCILAVDMHEPKFIVRLGSGERTTITARQLLRLTNGPRVFREFVDGSQSPDPLAMNLDTDPQLVYTGGDGQSDKVEDAGRHIGIARSRQRRLGVSGASFAQFFNPKTTRKEQPVVWDRSSSEESDELELSSESEEDVRPTSRRHLNRAAQKKTKRARESSEESFVSNRGTRVSTRLQKTTRYNFKERLEDDEMSEVEVVAPKKKFSGAKEQFVELPEDDPFREAHSNQCFSCGKWEDESSKQESLVFCQGCTSSYHRDCLGTRTSRKHLVTKVGADDFILQCSNCLGIKHRDHDILPHLGHCAICKEAGLMSTPLRESYTAQEEQQLREENGGIDPVTEVERSSVNNADNVLIRCTRCKRAFHVEHVLPTPEADRSDIRTDYWHCSECFEAPAMPLPIQAIVAWRSKNADVKVVPRLVELVPEIEKEYLVKWNNQSYFNVVWMPGDWVWCIARSAMFLSFLKSAKSDKPIWTTEEAVPEENLCVDIIFDVEYTRDPESLEERANPELVERAFVKFKGLTYEETVWEHPPKQTNAVQWQDFKTALADKVFSETIQPLKNKVLQERLKDARKKNFEDDLILKSQPEMVTGGKLMEYQMEGVNWMYYMYFQQRNAVLADDMGLGKTLQIITLLSALIENFECFPFLIVVPNSTVPNWRREIKSWAPKMRVVTYYGSAWARQMAEKHEMFHNGNLCCHVVIASYESMSDALAARVLGKINWAALVVDEGQRLKNDQTVLYDRLRRMRFGFKILLTGTPLQNNIRELFNLIQFLDPTKNAERLEEQYGGQLTKDDIRELHDMIRPCFLRRTKSEVLPFLPPMVQIIIPVSMSVVQKKLYKSILEKNPMLIKAIMKRHRGQINKKDRNNLNNIMMQLRKCLCHPFIYNRDIEEQTGDDDLAHQRLVEASGKLQLLNLMLPQLRQRGHRALIFSQFLENLDIVEDFLNGLGLKFCRLDGQLSSAEKQKQIDEFNAPNSTVFAFLLSTRSGGVGINLATADTVIIMDPDFNPKQDMQALSRAHRIGQKNTVLIFHLVVRSSVEEKIMQKGKTKLALDHVLIDRMEADEDEEDLESILQHGAQALFNDDDSADIKYDVPAIDKLLDRSQAEQAKVVTHGDDSNSNNQNQFNFARVWQIDRDSLEEVVEAEDAPLDSSVWQQILDEREREAQEQLSRKEEGLGRGKRKRPTISYNTKMQVDDEDDTELTPTKSPMAKMRKTAADHDYQEPDPAAATAESESDDDIEFMEDDYGPGMVNADNPPEMANVEDYPTPDVDFSQLATHNFHRIESPPPLPQDGFDGINDENLLRPCQACQQIHWAGSCPLRLAGLEFCRLCGLAHYGYRRVCPRFQSVEQIQRLLQALDLSPEEPQLISLARKYLQTCLRSIQSRENRIASAAQASAQSLTSPSINAAGIGHADSNVTGGGETIDLTQ